MSLSVVVCTRDRADKLPLFFASLRQLDSPADAEIIIVNNGSSDETRFVIDREVDGLPFNATTLNFSGSLSAAKNIGVAAARGEIVVFTDDDCYPDKDWLRRVDEFFWAWPNAQIVCGHVRLFDDTDYPVTITVEDSVWPKMSPSQAIWVSVHGCNLAVRREALLKIGGFDERLGPGTPACAAEDRDVIYRVATQFNHFYYDKTIRVSHHHRRKDDVAISKLVASYRAGEDAFWFKYASKLDIRVFKPVGKVMSFRYGRQKFGRVVKFVLVIVGMGLSYRRGRRLYKPGPD